MIRTVGITALLALLLSSCAMLHTTRTGDPRPTGVTVNEDATLVVDQEPLYVKHSGTVLRWYLPRGPHRFAAQGITIAREGAEDFVCNRLDDGKVFECVARYTKKGNFKYTITVERDGKTLAPALDPFIFQH